MARPKTSYEDYLNAGKAKNLTFVETHAPATIYDTVRWKCNVSGEIIRKSYQSVCKMPNGSRYQTFRNEFWPKFLTVAELLGIEFVYDPEKDYFPKSVHAKTKWKGRNGKEVMASFHELYYGHISKALQEKLGISDLAVKTVYEHHEKHKSVV